MERRTLGQQGLRVSALGLGCMGMSEFYAGRDDDESNSPRFQGDNFQRNLDLVERVEEIARRKRCTPGQLALAWLLAQGEDVVPIPGTKQRRYLEENVAALNVELTGADLEEMEEVAPKGVAAGDRYHEAGMRTING